MKHTVAVAILAISLSTSTGCTMMGDFKANMARTARMFRPRPFDETFDEATDPDIAVEDDWSKLVKEGRPNAEMERDPDRFWVEKVMSPQARNIERNLGFE